MIFIQLSLAGTDFEADTVEVTIQPGQSHSNVCVVITDDDVKEGPEKFSFGYINPKQCAETRS